MTTLTKTTTNKIRTHILDQFTERASWQGKPLDNLRAQIRALTHSNGSTRLAALDWVETGGALSYAGDVEQFLLTLNVLDTTQNYSYEAMWAIYRKLIATEICKIMKEQDNENQSYPRQNRNIIQRNEAWQYNIPIHNAYNQ